MPVLQITNLTANIGDTPILKGIDLTVNAGEVHAVMGPNGSGKSTLAQVIAGHPAYTVTGGQVRFEAQDLLSVVMGASTITLTPATISIASTKITLDGECDETAALVVNNG